MRSVWDGVELSWFVSLLPLAFGVQGSHERTKIQCNLSISEGSRQTVGKMSKFSSKT